MSDRTLPETEAPGQLDAADNVTVLRVLPGHAASKSFAPDPSGQRLAIKAGDYDLGAVFLAQRHQVIGIGGLLSLLRALETDGDGFIVRGQIAEGRGELARLKGSGRTGRRVNRRTTEKHGDAGDIEDTPRRWLCLDIDGLELPPWLDDLAADPEGAARYARSLLPEEFHAAAMVVQLSASAGLSAPPGLFKAHLWVWLREPVGSPEARRWAGWVNHRTGFKLIDPAVFSAVQPHYVSAPVLLDGLADPFAGRRTFMLSGEHQAVALRLPSEEDLALMASERGKAVRAIAKRAGVGAGEVQVTPDAVRVGRGWEGFLRGIGINGNIRRQMLAGVGAWVASRGVHADPEPLRQAVRHWVEHSPFLDAGEGTRTREDARAYVTGGNLDGMIRDLIEAERRKLVRAATAPALPAATVEEASDLVVAALADFGADTAAKRAAWDAYCINGREDHAVWDDDDERPTRPETDQSAIIVGTGVGKTEAMVRRIVELLRTDPDARVAYFVPEHGLAAGVEERLNRAAGEIVATTWRGISQPAPNGQGEAMCPMHHSVVALEKAGGRREHLCGSPKRGYCSRHPAVAGESACAYQVQLRARARLWIMPGNMLSAAPPKATRRPPLVIERDGEEVQIQPRHFDLVVIDEAPWKGLVGGIGASPYRVRLVDLAPEDWEVPARRGEPDDKATSELRSVLEGLRKVIEDAADGPVDPLAIHEATGGADVLRKAWVYAWRCHQDVGKLVDPDMSPDEVVLATASASLINAKVHKVARLLMVAADLVDGRTGPAAIKRRTKAGAVTVDLKWREPIHEQWLRADVTYLDADGDEAVARAWLPGLVVKAEALAAAPHMKVVQVTDRTLGKSAVVVNPEATPATQTTQRNTQAELGRFLEVLAARFNGKGALLPDGSRPDVLAIMPKGAEHQMAASGLIPANVETLHFGVVRGVDRYKGVAALVVIGRPEAAPDSAEDQAEIIYGVPVKRIAGFYPKTMARRRMADGTERLAEVHHHPDPKVEAVRAAIANAEVSQAVGRGRGVRRGAENPLAVFVLTDLVIREPVDDLVEFDELMRMAGPVELMIARGVVPVDRKGQALVVGWEYQAWRDWTKNHAQASADLDRWCAGEFVEFPNSSSLLAFSTKSALGFLPFQYRREGTRQGGVVLVNARRQPDPRAAAERWLGQLDRWEPVAASIPSETPEQAEASHLVEPPTPIEIEPEQEAPMSGEPETITMKALERAIGRQARDFLRRPTTKRALDGLTGKDRELASAKLLRQAFPAAFQDAVIHLTGGAAPWA